jgi:hypothetical protein
MIAFPITNDVLRELKFEPRPAGSPGWSRDFGNGVSLVVIEHPAGRLTSAGWLVELWNERDGVRSGASFGSIFTCREELVMVCNFNDEVPF